MYAIIKNNLRAIEFLHKEKILICVIPGPSEPSLEEMNYILEPFITEVTSLYQGGSYIITLFLILSNYS